MITELRTLIAVARYGTFSAAGDRVGLTQAAVSGHIRRLEETLGFTLFDRTGRSATLNPAGLRTLARAEALVAGFDALGAPIQDDEWAKPLEIGAIASVQATILTRALVPFRQRYPNCRVNLSPGVSLQLMDKVETGELDLAILIRPAFEPPRELEWTPLAYENYVLLAARNVQGDDWRGVLREQPFIRYNRSSFGGRQVERFLRDNAVALQEWIEVDDIQAMLSMVESGLGVALVPLTETILPLPASVRAISLGPTPIHREIGALYPKLTHSAAVAGFIECLQSAGVLAASCNK
ncbi:MAG: LysR family transcriptional regulator [Gammaproteobacteria bacterium]|nr:LysR family transcriptional regulator [Gammaproteobacteria bacterium]MBU1489578.1 LysR family transcriptional regulator [Gammaproteobacteria bacterium]MBU2067803.1 LysR family transcriptional regulator [Gammaproteobacteria bacterium]MBU2140986.1 LysR family transcriptional regulator [Gammaproteobacteria bacterium]MBU2217383.1 LysR family transcriptional regulator [Gammaproteobacteria bacterium]